MRLFNWVDLKCLDTRDLVDCPTQLYCTWIFHDKAKRTQQGNLLRTMAIEEGWGGWPAAFRFHSQPSQPWQLLSTCRALTQPPTISLAHTQYLSHHICHFFTITILRTHNLYLTIFGLTHNLTHFSLTISHGPHENSTNTTVDPSLYVLNHLSLGAVVCS